MKKSLYINFVAPVNGYSVQQMLQLIDMKYQDGYDCLHILINSPGGSVSHGLALYNILKGVPMEIRTYNIGSVDSISVVVFCAGDKRFAVPNCRFLIHPVQLQLHGAHVLNEHQLSEYSKSIISDQENIIGVISDTTRRDKTEIADKMHERTTYNAEEAKDIGLVHDILDMPFLPKQAEVMAVYEYPDGPPMPRASEVQGGVRVRDGESFTSIYPSGVAYAY